MKAFIIDQFDSVIAVIPDASVIQGAEFSVNGSRFTKGKRVLVAKGGIHGGTAINAKTFKFSTAKRYEKRSELDCAGYARAHDLNGMQVFTI